MRNSLEKKVGDFLIDEYKFFKYEEYLNVNKKAYFPDFIIEDIIIEVTEWKHPTKEKIKRLKEKIKNYKLANYKIIFFIPKLYRKFYKDFENSIVSTLDELKEFLRLHSSDEDN